MKWNKDADSRGVEDEKSVLCVHVDGSEILHHVIHVYIYIYYMYMYIKHPMKKWELSAYQLVSGISSINSIQKYCQDTQKSYHQAQSHISESPDAPKISQAYVILSRQFLGWIVWGLLLSVSLINLGGNIFNKTFQFFIMHQSQLADLYIICVSGSSELIEKWTSYPTLEITNDSGPSLFLDT